MGEHRVPSMPTSLVYIGIGAVCQLLQRLALTNCMAQVSTIMSIVDFPFLRTNGQRGKNHIKINNKIRKRFGNVFFLSYESFDEAYERIFLPD